MSSRNGSPSRESEAPNTAHDETNKETVDQDSSAGPSQPGSAGARPKGKKRVGFTGGVSLNDPSSSSQQPISLDGVAEHYLSPPSFSPEYGSGEGSGNSTPGRSPDDRRLDNDEPEQQQRRVDKSHLPELSLQQTRDIRRAFEQAMPIARPRPAIRRSALSDSGLTEEDIEGPDETGQRALRQARQREAFERGKRLEEDQRSAPPSRDSSLEREHPGDIPLEDLSRQHSSEDGSDDPGETHRLQRAKSLHHAEAHRLVRKHMRGRERFRHENESPQSGLRSGAATPTEEQEFAHDYRPRPEQYRGGVLGTLLKLYNQPIHDHGHDSTHSRGSSVASLIGHRRRRSSNSDSGTPTPQHSPPGSGTVTPNGGSPGTHWLSRKHRNHSSSSLAHLIGSSASLSTPVVAGFGEHMSSRLREHREQERRPKLGHRVRSSAPVSAFNRLSRPRLEEEIRITKHIAETIARQKFLMRLCRALMLYGAPTHRLEEYMKMSARVLEVDAQFLYIPGSMIMSFDDPATHTTEVKLVKVAQGLDLGKLRDVHEIYKEVVHDVIGVEEATSRLKETMGRKAKYSRFLRIPVFGLAAACVGPFAFSARLIDLPMAFVLGCILGVLQLVVAPASDLYANVFEVFAATTLSFLSRALGSIPYRGGRLFCFSALAQSSIALILPGYIVLCASLELQSKSLVAGSVRMVYAIIYSLFLGFGLTVGIAIYGLIDSNATSESTCSDPMGEFWFFFFVPLFALCLAIINQAKWKQMPAMIIIAFAGYVANYFSSKRFAGNTQISSTVGAFAIGIAANSYSRLGSRIENWALDQWEDRLRPYWKGFIRRIRRLPRSSDRRRSPKTLEEGVSAHADTESLFVRQGRRVGYSLAATAMLPAIFVLVPSGLGIQGSLVAGIDSANQIVGNATNGTTVVNSTTLLNRQDGMNGIAFDVGYGVIQVAIGITVGLFLSAIIVYPLGKRRSGLFSF